MRFKTEADHNLNCNIINSSPIFSLVHVQETKDAKVTEKKNHRYLTFFLTIRYKVFMYIILFPVEG